MKIIQTDSFLKKFLSINAFAALIFSIVLFIGVSPVVADWAYFFEDFEVDFIEFGENPNGWDVGETHGNLDIVQNSSNTYNGGANQGYLDVSAQSNEVAMLKKFDVQGGTQSQVSTEFYLNVNAESFSGSDSSFAVASFRDPSGTIIGRCLITDIPSGTYGMRLYYDGTYSSSTISGLSSDTWYKVTFSYDDSSSTELGLTVETVGGTNLGSIGLASISTGVKTFMYGKTSYDLISGELWLDEISIFVPEVYDLWVDDNGSDLNSGLSSDDPLATIQKAVNMAGPGTTIHILPGTYNQKTRITYLGLNPSDQDITIRGEGTSANEVIIDGTGITFTDNWGGLFQIQNTNHIILENVLIQNSSSFGVYGLNIHNVAIRNLQTSNTGFSGVEVNDSSYFSIYGVDISNSCRNGSQESLSVGTVSNFSIYNNAIHDGPVLPGGEGIAVKGNSSNGAIYNNKVYNLDGDVGIYVGVGGEGTVTSKINVYQNEIYNTDHGIAVTSEYGGTIEYIDIFNNVIHDGKYGGILIVKWRENEQPGVVGFRRHIRIFNNTVVNMASTANAGIHMQCDVLANIEDVLISNNIVSNNANGGIIVPASVQSTVVLSNNLIDDVNGIQPGDPYCSNCVGGDPLFVGSGSDPYDIQPGSAAIDVGTLAYTDMNYDGSNELLSFDYTNDVRPQGSSYDIGAYETPGVVYNLSVNVVGENLGGGVVTSVPGAINCEEGNTGVCSYSFGDGVVATLNATPDLGSYFVGWSGDCTGTAACVLNMNQDHSVTATFSLNAYTVDFEAGLGGTLSGVEHQNVWYNGDTSAVLAVADGMNGYHFVSWTLVSASGTMTTTENPLIITNVTSNTTATANFELNTYLIATDQNSDNGVIFPDDPYVPYGSDQLFTITPIDGYSIVDVFIDGISIGSVSEYTFTNVTSDHSIYVVFSVNSLTSAFTYLPSNPDTGDVIEFFDTSEAPVGTEIISWSWDFGDGTTSADQFPTHQYNVPGTYIVTLIVTDNSEPANTSIYSTEIVISAVQYNLVVNLAGNGAGSVISAPAGINCPSDCSEYFADGTSVVLTATPAVGSTFTGWGGVCSGTGTCAVSVDGDESVTAMFSINTYTITSSAGANGTITPVGSQTVNYGADVTYSIAPATGYYIVDVRVDGVSVGGVFSYTFWDVAANHTIDAVFALIPNTPPANPGGNTGGSSGNTGGYTGGTGYTGNAGATGGTDADADDGSNGNGDSNDDSDKDGVDDKDRDNGDDKGKEKDENDSSGSVDGTSGAGGIGGDEYTGYLQCCLGGLILLFILAIIVYLVKRSKDRLETETQLNENFIN
ncbi:right-handed parallel beta-helix repeat-containing protein [Candidatus Dojkabacteria bacterium]|nr:right-handed parallel beta-helix repeat-containing protein [Candidatus Dojkabacteria bacterium]